MNPIDSPENLRGVQHHPNNDIEDSKNHSSNALSHHDNTTPPTVYSSNTIMTSFNNVEQSYTRVVGQVYSRETRETVTTIYKDPQTNFWNQRPIVYLCHFCHSSINPQEIKDISSFISCTSPNCNVYAHTGCLMKSGFHDSNRSWYCPKCMPPHKNYSPPIRSMELLNDNNVETNQTLPVNPLHLLLEASDQIQSNSRPQMNFVNNMSFTRLADSSAPHIENNCTSTRPKLITSEEFASQPFSENNLSIDSIIDSEKAKIEDVLPSKFEYQYALYEEERNNTIRNLERTRTRQNQVTKALKESVVRLTREHTKQLERYESLEKDNEKLNNSLHRLKLALIPLAQERPVLQILRKMTQIENLRVQDIDQDNVLQLFLRLLPSSPANIIDVSPITSLPSSNAVASMSSSNINIPTLPTISSSLYERCQKCSKIGGRLVSCMSCHIIQHVACCSKGENLFIETMNIQWLCIDCKNANSKRKNYTDKNTDTKVASSNLLGGYKRIKVCNPIKENGTKSKSSSLLYNISTQNLDEGVLSPQLTPHKVETNEGNVEGNMEIRINDQYQKQNSTDLILPDTPMSGDNESDDSSFTSITEIDVESNHDGLRSLDRAPPPDNGPEVTRQPARFDGDMYTPRWVRGVGKSKEGLCPHCEPTRWLKTKISAYWYHLNYQHGISSITGRPFAQPTAERVNKKTGMKEALCHKCNKWILNQSPRDKDVLVPEIYWYKHAQKCHHTGS